VETTIEVTVERADGADQIEGRVRTHDGCSRPFTGYVGLLAAIDTVLADEHVATPRPRVQPHRSAGRRW
jgi:hypothetical protein